MKSISIQVNGQWESKAKMIKEPFFKVLEYCVDSNICVEFGKTDGGYMMGGTLMTYEEFKEMINYLEDYHLEHKLSEDDIKLLKFNNCWSEDELPYCSWNNYDRHISSSDAVRIKKIYDRLIKY